MTRPRFEIWGIGQPAGTSDRWGSWARTVGISARALSHAHERAGMETYSRYNGFGVREVRPIGEPITHVGEAPKSLVGRLVNVRPYYSVPSGRSSLTSVRSPFVYEAKVIETHGEEMVQVRFTLVNDSAPWNREAAFYPKELHQAHVCECAACKGTGLHNKHAGA